MLFLGDTERCQSPPSKKNADQFSGTTIACPIHRSRDRAGDDGQPPNRMDELRYVAASKQLGDIVVLGAKAVFWLV